MLSKTIPSVCWGNNIIKEFPIKSKNKFPLIGKNKVNIYFQYIYIEGDLGIVILISKFPNLCHDMKAYPRI